ncbi:MAG: hypothetical protein HYW45_01555 [Candidatus Daviesbacteria bacterium]|nr:MAG: hypothetical protein HYW45_01555 [Candidatus Daviesbacteria bacterium]
MVVEVLKRFDPKPQTASNLVRFDLYDPPLLSMDDESYLLALEGFEPEEGLNADFEEEIDPQWEEWYELGQESMRRYEEECCQEVARENLVNNPVYKRCNLKEFLSRTKGKSRGRGRKRCTAPRRRRFSKEITLISTDRGKSYHQYKDGYKLKIDTVATEIYGNSVPAELAAPTLVAALRKLPQQRRLARTGRLPVSLTCNY